MLLKRTIHKTKNLLHKTLLSIKLFVLGEYQKLPKAPSLNLFSSRSNKPKVQQLDDFYRNFCEQWESDCNKLTPRNDKSTISEKENVTNKIAADTNQKVFKNKQEKRGKEEHKTASSQRGNGGGGSHALAQKMKELEMMEVHDVDHVLDIEEVLHYYSRLKSPVYQDLVDTFFMDMYSEFFIPQPSATASTNSSMRRLGPLKI